MRHRPRQPRQRLRVQLVFGGGAGVAHRAQDAPTGGQYLPVAAPLQFPLQLVLARPGEDQVRVRVHEAGHHEADLVALQMPDEVPAYTGKGIAPLPQVLSVVLAKVADAQLQRTTLGRTSIDLFTPASAIPEIEGEYAKCRDPNYRSEVLAASSDVDLEKLAEALRALGADCYRAKGHLPSNGTLHFIDLSSSGLTITETSRRGTQGQLALILKGSAPEDTTSAIRSAMVYNL